MRLWYFTILKLKSQGIFQATPHNLARSPSLDFWLNSKFGKRRNTLCTRKGYAASVSQLTLATAAQYFSFFKLKKWGKKTAAARRHNCAVLPSIKSPPFYPFRRTFASFRPGRGFPRAKENRDRSKKELDKPITILYNVYVASRENGRLAQLARASA